MTSSSVWIILFKSTVCCLKFVKVLRFSFGYTENIHKEMHKISFLLLIVCFVISISCQGGDESGGGSSGSSSNINFVRTGGKYIHFLLRILLFTLLYSFIHQEVVLTLIVKLLIAQ